MEDVLKKRGSCLMVYVPQELDHHFATQITDEVDKELKKGNVRQLVFDFSGTTFMDSSGIGMLMGRYRLLHYSGGRVSAIHVNDRVNIGDGQPFLQRRAGTDHGGSICHPVKSHT